MDIFIFDIDNTIADTTELEDYRQTAAGREAIPDAIANEKVSITYNQQLVELINDLAHTSNTVVIAISDSSTDYAKYILEILEVDIDPDLIFGNAKKPYIDTRSITSAIEDHLECDINLQDAIVIGDNPKDIYMAHYISCPSVLFLNPGFTSSFNIQAAGSCEPTIIARSFSDLEVALEEYQNGELSYDPDEIEFNQSYDTAKSLSIEIPEIDIDDVGYSKQYIPRNEWSKRTHFYDKNFYHQVHFAIKNAKNKPVRHHRKNGEGRYFIRTQEGIEARKAPGLKTIAGFHAPALNDWARKKELTGKILLVPIPPSSPSYCSRSFPILEIAKTISYFSTGNENNDEFYFSADELLERTIPVRPAHQTQGQRSTTPHENTIGIHEDFEIDDDITNIILIDDIVTSGTQMRVAKALIEGVERFAHIDVHMFAIGKTTHPSPFEDLTFDDL